MKKSERLMLADAAKSGLTAEDMEGAHITAMGPLATRRFTRSSRYAVCSARYPFYDEHGVYTDYDQLKLLERVETKETDRRTKKVKTKVVKNWTMSKPPQLYIPQIPKIEKVFEDRRVSIGIAEGVKKAIKACKEFEITFGLLSAWVFSSKKYEIDFLADLKRLAENGRECYLTLDGDGHMNRLIKMAEERFCSLWMKFGGIPYIRQLPPGIQYDDYLIREGAEGARKVPVRRFDVKSHVSLIRRIPAATLPAHDKKEMIAGTVIADMKEIGTFFNTPDGPLYFDSKGSKPIDLSDPGVVALNSHMYEKYGINASEDEFKYFYVAAVAEATSRRSAFADPRYFAHRDADTGTLYVAASETEMFRITETGVRRVSNGTDGVILKAPATMDPVTVLDEAPSRSVFDHLLEIPNIVDGESASADEMRMLFEFWLWGIICGRDVAPTWPITLLHGPAGAAKTAEGKALNITLYGAEQKILTLDKRRIDGLDAALTSKHMIVLDNIDGNVPNIENRLATAGTGGSIAMRKLYKTNVLLEIPIRAFVMVTSRQPASFTRDDVVQRLLYLKVEKRPDYIAEAIIMRRVMRRRQAWWIYVLSVLPRVVRALNQQRQQVVDFRMADFAAFAFTIAPILGYKANAVRTALRHGESEKVSFVAEQTALPDAIAALVDSMHVTAKRNGFDIAVAEHFFGVELSATTLLGHLSKQPGFQQGATPQWLGQQITQDWQAIKLRVPSMTAKQDSHTKTWKYIFSKPKTSKT